MYTLADFWGLCLLWALDNYCQISIGVEIMVNVGYSISYSRGCLVFLQVVYYPGMADCCYLLVFLLGDTLAFACLLRAFS